jgi:hypothetical protein
MPIELTIPIVENDLLATRRDVKNLSAIVSHLQSFINDPEGDGRNKFNYDLMRYQVLLDESQALEKIISDKLISLHSA